MKSDPEKSIERKISILENNENYRAKNAVDREDRKKKRE